MRVLTQMFLRAEGRSAAHRITIPSAAHLRRHNQIFRFLVCLSLRLVMQHRGDLVQVGGHGSRLQELNVADAVRHQELLRRPLLHQPVLLLQNLLQFRVFHLYFVRRLFFCVGLTAEADGGGAIGAVKCLHFVAVLHLVVWFAVLVVAARDQLLGG